MVVATEGDTDGGRTLDERLGSTDGAIDAARLCALEELAALECLPTGTATASITQDGPEEAIDDALDALGLCCLGALGTTSA